MPSLVETFFEDLTVGMRALLKSKNFELPAKVPSGLAKEPVYGQLLGAYFNMLQRRIPPRVRRVEWSRELRARTDLDADDKAGLAKLEAVSTVGGDLNPHQSKLIADFLYYDGLFDDWGYVHLHYGLPSGDPTIAPFVNRSRNVAFVIETDDALRFIDVLPHGRDVEQQPWAMRRLLDIAHRNWPKVLPGFVSDMPAGRGPGPSDKDIFEARKGGVNALVPIDGKMFAGRGISSAKISSRVVGHAFAVQRWVRRIAAEGEKDTAARLEAFNKLTSNTLAELNLRIGVRELDWTLQAYVYEEQTATEMGCETYLRPR
jgi:hypothetical protein